MIALGNLHASYMNIIILSDTTTTNKQTQQVMVAVEHITTISGYSKTC